MTAVNEEPDDYSALDQVSPRLRPNPSSPTAALTSPPQQHQADAPPPHHYPLSPLAEPLPHAAATSNCLYSAPESERASQSHLFFDRESGTVHRVLGDESMPYFAHRSERANTMYTTDHYSNTNGDPLMSGFLIDHDHLGLEDPYMMASRQRRKPSSGLCAQIWTRANVGVIGILLCLACLASGLILRFLPNDGGAGRSHEHEAGRFLLSSGIFGLATSLSNYVAVQVLLRTLFFRQNEMLLQTSIREIVMSLFFNRDMLEKDVVSHLRKSLATAPFHRTLERLVQRDEIQQLVRQYTERFFRTPHGTLLAMHGVTVSQVEGVLMPGLLHAVTEIAPVLQQVVRMDDLCSSETVFQLLDRTVSHQAAALSVSDLKVIVSGVLSPSLSLIVLWGSVVGLILGAVGETFELGSFLSGCKN
jgi:hypothetical protein